MVSYSILWPIGNILEQTFVEKKTFDTYDWKKVMRFSLYGAFVMGPTLYLWMRMAWMMWPGRDFRSSIAKALTEQVSYDPAGITTFLFTMSLAEKSTLGEAAHEVRAKFFDTWKVGVVYWPLVQTFNFACIPMHNQVVFTSFFSMIWTSFLAYMKHLELQAETNEYID